MESRHHKHTVEIGGVTYFVSHPDPEIAWETGIELSKIIGEPISALALAAASNGKSEEIFPIAMRKLLDRIEPKQSLIMVKKILSTVEVQTEDGKKFLLTSDAFKIHFRGKAGDIIKLVSEVLAYTHKDFFDAIGDGIAKAMNKVGEKA